MHAIGPYSQNAVTFPYTYYLFIELVEIKPVCSLCNSYQVNTIITDICFFCRKHFIAYVSSLELIVQLTLTCITSNYILKVFAKPYSSLPIAGSTIPCHIFVRCYIAQIFVKGIGVKGSGK